MKLLKVNFAVVAFLLGSAIAITQSSFTAAKEKARSGTEYQFNGTTSAEEKSASEYSASSSPSCSGSNLVCTINVSGNLQTWLNNHTTAQILAAADETRN